MEVKSLFPNDDDEDYHKLLYFDEYKVKKEVVKVYYSYTLSLNEKKIAYNSILL